MSHTAKFPISFIFVTVLIVAAVWSGLRKEEWRSESQDLAEKLLTTSPSSIVKKSTKESSFESLPSPVRAFFSRALPSLEKGKPIPTIRSLHFSQTGKFRLSEHQAWVTFSARQIVSASASPGFVWEAEMPLIKGLGWPRVYIRDAWFGDKAQLKATLEGIWPIASDDSQSLALLEGEIMRWLAEAFLVPTALLPSSGNVAWSELGSRAQGNKVQLSMEYTESESGPKSETNLVERNVRNIVLNVTFLEQDSGQGILIEGMRPRRGEGTFATSPWIGKLSQWKKIEIKDSLEAFSFPTHMECGWKNPDDESIFFYFVADNHDYQYDWQGDDTVSSTI